MIRKFLKNGSKLFSGKQQSIFSAASVLAAAFSFSAILGVLRDRLIYGKFYACCASRLDAYNAAFRIPDMVFRLLVIGALSAAFIPVFTSELAKNKEKAFEIASSIINILFFIFFIVTIFVFIFAEPLSGLIASGFDAKQIELMANLTRIMLLAQLFFLVSNFMTGVLQSYRHFLMSSLSPLVYNLGIIIGILFFSKSYGIYGPAFGVVVGAFFHLLIQLPVVSKLGFKYSFTFDYRLKGVRRILRLMLPRSLALGLSEIQATFILFLGSMLGTGQISLFYLGQRLVFFFSRLFGVTIGQAALPVLANDAGRSKLKGFKKTFLSSFLQAVFFAFPTSMIFIVLRVLFVRLAYGGQQFPWEATIVTGKIMLFLAPLVVLNTANDILVRSFYALQNTKTPLIGSIIGLVVNFVVSFILVLNLNWGVYGLAVASSCAVGVEMIVLLIFFLRQVNFEKVGLHFFAPLGVMVFSGGLASVVTWLFLHLGDFSFDTTRLAGVLLVGVFSVLGGVTTYFITSLFFGLKQANLVLKLIKRILVWPRTALLITELPPRVE